MNLDQIFTDLSLSERESFIRMYDSNSSASSIALRFGMAEYDARDMCINYDEYVANADVTSDVPTRKYYLMQHREDRMVKEKQVEFFERKRKPTVGEMFANKLMNDAGVVPGYTVECTQGHIHVIVMAESELVALAGLSSEVHEIVIATY